MISRPPQTRLIIVKSPLCKSLWEREPPKRRHYIFTKPITTPSAVISRKRQKPPRRRSGTMNRHCCRGRQATAEPSFATGSTSATSGATASAPTIPRMQWSATVFLKPPATAEESPPGRCDSFWTKSLQNIGSGQSARLHFPKTLPPCVSLRRTVLYSRRSFRKTAPLQDTISLPFRIDPARLLSSYRHPAVGLYFVIARTSRFFIINPRNSGRLSSLSSILATSI